MKALQNQRAAVTGGGSGIGRATCIALANAGAKVAVMDMNEEGAKETCALLADSGGDGVSLKGSVAESADVTRMFAELDTHWGGVDILVNNAGVSGNRPTLELTDEEWRRTMAINVDGVFYCAREAARRMKAQGKGAIVNIGSIYSIVAAPNRISYCASKAAVGMMTKALAVEWAEFGIRVNGVAPGYVDTPLIRELAADGRLDYEALVKRTPQRRLALPEEIGDAVVFLCEPRAAHIAGQMLAVDGGWTAYGYI
ncbi:NAD(P)-dependent dehydrogenase (short-subunit alcohol dehydrogenase family) [Paraburkholderia sp. BL27I4N3]|uniref:SDR family NAD(P)-dependent oxidoreductase n=1 Tax=Paraburkholderia sp. BL27I4N3 TaxID=1938805 RepID=UPI000E247C75|nr:SDR family oxidoreductase [Paraburkholderia sp. BL27I4N3]REE07103.1 NAD(P)-dependent dehydrogenase (short-subunit alcohol dehydrogenase family) [Paraburkholderia sp. BL27I4N3]